MSPGRSTHVSSGD